MSSRVTICLLNDTRRFWWAPWAGTRNRVMNESISYSLPPSFMGEALV